jgi:trimethylamine--corrinoid protein Co-methyltransferase
MSCPQYKSLAEDLIVKPTYILKCQKYKLKSHLFKYKTIYNLFQIDKNDKRTMKMRIKSEVSALSLDERKMIHSAALEILEKNGGYVEHPEICDLLKKTGCSVNGFNVKIPKKVSEKIVEKMRNAGQAKKNYCNHYKRDDKGNSSRLRCGVTGQAIQTIDRQTGKIRAATSIDLHDICKLINALDDESIAFGHPPFIVQDVEPMLRDLHTWAITAQYSGQPHSVEPFSIQSVDYFLELGSVFSGSMEKCLEDPPFMYCAYFTPPLKFSRHALEIAWKLYKRGVRSRISFSGVMPVMGMSAPVTIAGTLASGAAEVILGNGISIAMLGEAQPFSMGPVSLDMKTMIHTQSSPEASLLYLGVMDMARFYGFEQPVLNYSLSSDSKTSDVQAGIEKAYKSILAFLGGSATISAGLGVLSCAHIVSFEQFIIDYEMFLALKRLMRGIEVSKETIALDLILKKGLDGTFLDTDHTFENYSKEIQMTDCFDHTATGNFIRAPKTMLIRASEKVDKLIAEAPEKTFISPEQEEEISRILKSAAKNIAA